MQDSHIAYWCLLVGGLMTHFIVTIAKSSHDYDNEKPA